MTRQSDNHLLYVPASHRRLIFEHLHPPSRPGIPATQDLITQRYVWPNINKDVRAWTRSCLSCQKAKVTRDTMAPTGTFNCPDAHLDHIHFYIVGSLPPSNGFKHLLSCIDFVTDWPEAIPIADITAETVAQSFVTRWISVFDVPSTVTTVGGTQFQSAPFRSQTYSDRFVRYLLSSLCQWNG